jgi:hypothetical protein
MLVSRTVLGGEAMNIDNLVLAAISTHLAPRVTESNATTELLTRLGLDPSDFTFGFIFNRLIGIAAAGINLANMFALAGAIFFVATLLMRDDSSTAHRRDNQRCLLHRLWRAGKFDYDIHFVLSVAAHQQRSSLSDGQIGQKGAGLRAG